MNKIKFKRSVLLNAFIVFLTVMLGITNVFAEAKTELEIFYDDCYNNIDKLVIEKDDIDVTKDEISSFKQLYLKGSYSKLNNYCSDKGLSLSVAVKSNARSYSTYTLKKVYNYTRSKTFKPYGESKTVDAKWTIIAKTNYTVNETTGKISKVGPLYVSLASIYGYDELEQFYLHTYDGMESKKVNDNEAIYIKFKFHIEAKYSANPYYNLTFGPYTKEATYYVV